MPRTSRLNGNDALTQWTTPDMLQFAFRIVGQPRAMVVSEEFSIAAFPRSAISEVVEPPVLRWVPPARRPGTPVQSRPSPRSCRSRRDPPERDEPRAGTQTGYVVPLVTHSGTLRGCAGRAPGGRSLRNRHPVRGCAPSSRGGWLPPSSGRTLLVCGNHDADLVLAAALAMPAAFSLAKYTKA